LEVWRSEYPAFVVSHISRKTSEMWGTQKLVGNDRLQTLSAL
jgi:hypothetical protein